MRILALDTATVTGWATNCAGGCESGFQAFELRRGSSPGMRFLEFNIWLEGLVGKLQPQVIVFEQAHHRGGAATEIGVGMATRVMEAAARHHIEYRSIHSGTLKKWATGSGAADKTAMKRRASEMWGVLIADDNEADAILMLEWAMAGFPESERKAKRPACKAQASPLLGLV